MKAFIIHVSDAYEREKHITNELKGKKLKLEFINSGDIKDLSNAILSDFFAGKMKKKSAASSCAYKHLLAYKKIIEQNIPYALILEDDIVFYKKFDILLPKIENEIKQQALNSFLISLEDSQIEYVARSKRQKNKILYPQKKGRLAGAYIIDRKAAKNILSRMQHSKCSLPIDWFHNECADNNLVQIYWAHPVLAVQGSLNGRMKSLIDNKSMGLWRIFAFKIQRIYKKILYSLR